MYINVYRFALNRVMDTKQQKLNTCISTFIYIILLFPIWRIKRRLKQITDIQFISNAEAKNFKGLNQIIFSLWIRKIIYIYLENIYGNYIQNFLQSFRFGVAMHKPHKMMFYVLMSFLSLHNALKYLHILVWYRDNTKV